MKLTMFIIKPREVIKIWSRVFTGPVKILNKDMRSDNLEVRIKANRFVSNKEFSVLDHKQRGQQGPVQSGKDSFGLDKFLEEAKQHGDSKGPSGSSCPGEHEDRQIDRRNRWLFPFRENEL